MANTHMSAMQAATHDYIGTAKCGCVVAIVVDTPGFEKQTAKDVASFISDGLIVERLPHTEACERFGRKPECAAHNKPMQGALAL